MEDATYWDPMPHLPAVVGSDPPFKGAWGDRNWRNVPGPLYGALTDNCWVGRVYAPRHILYGGDDNFESEFLYRQPRTVEELRDVVAGMSDDPFAGWACDGDAHWTPALVRAWWRDRGRVGDWITARHREWSVADKDDEREAADGLLAYLAYLDGELAGHLRAYLFFLDNGSVPRVGDRLPSL